MRTESTASSKFDDGNGRTGRALVQIILRRRGIAPFYIPPISVVLASRRERYIEGLTLYRENRVSEWIESFAVCTAQSANLATAYLAKVQELTGTWRAKLQSGANPRADAAAWVLIDLLPAHPVITSATASLVTGRAKAAIHQAIEQLVDAEILMPISKSKRNQSWEAVGLLKLIENLEAGKLPG